MIVGNTIVGVSQSISDIEISRQLAILRGNKTVFHVVETAKSHYLQVGSNLLRQFEAKHAQLV
jgi:hypothetical protein